MFQNKAQVDVVAVLMLLVESTIWKIIWSRLRSQRRNLTDLIFSILPGWAPLAATLLAWLSDADRPPNLIFDRCPDGATDSNLLLKISTPRLYIPQILQFCRVYGRRGFVQTW